MLKGSRPSRVITVAGAPRFLKNPRINFEDIQLENQFSGLRAAAQAMFARTLFTFELAKRLEETGVTAVAFHPGLVKSHLLRTPQNAPWYLKVMAPFMQALAKDDCEIGVYLAAAREIEKVNGVFFNERMQIVPLMPFHNLIKEDMGRKLWSMSEELTGISTV
jgi:NAD(P)-dependent dehydrogenase (short-subunit alcohol dehydrogenase family)